VTDLRPDDLTDAASDREEEEVAYGVSPETVQTAREALEAHQGHIVRELLAGLHAADVADLLEQLSPKSASSSSPSPRKTSRQRLSPTSTRTCARR